MDVAGGRLLILVVSGGGVTPPPACPGAAVAARTAVTGQYGGGACRGERRAACGSAQRDRRAPRLAHAPNPPPPLPAHRPDSPSMKATLNQLSIFHYKKMLIHYLCIFSRLAPSPVTFCRLIYAFCSCTNYYPCIVWVIGHWPLNFAFHASRNLCNKIINVWWDIGYVDMLLQIPYHYFIV